MHGSKKFSTVNYHVACRNLSNLTTLVQLYNVRHDMCRTLIASSIANVGANLNIDKQSLQFAHLLFVQNSLLYSMAGFLGKYHSSKTLSATSILFLPLILPNIKYLNKKKMDFFFSLFWYLLFNVKIIMNTTELCMAMLGFSCINIAASLVVFCDLSPSFLYQIGRLITYIIYLYISWYAFILKKY